MWLMHEPRHRPVASLASSGVVLVAPGAFRISTSSAGPAAPPAVLLAAAASEDSTACTETGGPLNGALCHRHVR